MCAYTRSHAHWSWCLSQNRIHPCACAPSRVCQIAIHKSYAVLMHMTDTNNTFFGRSKCPCRCDNKSPPSVRLLRNPITVMGTTHFTLAGPAHFASGKRINYPIRIGMQCRFRYIQQAVEKIVKTKNTNPNYPPLTLQPLQYL